VDSYQLSFLGPCLIPTSLGVARVTGDVLVKGRQSTLLNSFSERLPIKKNGESGEIEDEQSGKKKTTHKLFSIMSSCDRELECKTEQVG